MKITAVVEVVHREFASQDVVNKRGAKTYLTVGYTLHSKRNVTILHQTTKNEIIAKYPVCNNVLNIHDKFLSEGKMTIRFDKPPVDVLIRGQPKLIKEFYGIVFHSIVHKDKPHKKLTNLKLASKLLPENLPALKVSVFGEKNYGDLPGSILQLELISCEIKEFDYRILRLQHLKVLDLRNNELESIPLQIELLPSLEEIYLQNNKLGKSPLAWLDCDSLRKTLQHLDLSRNEITYTPQHFVLLKNLKTLRLDFNKIDKLPSGIGTLNKLRTFTASHNCISLLPGSVLLLKLDTFDISGNIEPESVPERTMEFPTLVMIAGDSLLRNRIPYDNKSLPKTLVTLLDSVGYCICGTPSLLGSEQVLPFHCVLRKIKANIVVGSTAFPMVVFNSCHKGCRMYPG